MLIICNLKEAVHLKARTPLPGNLAVAMQYSNGIISNHLEFNETIQIILPGSNKQLIFAVISNIDKHMLTKRFHDLFCSCHKFTYFLIILDFEEYFIFLQCGS